MSTLRKLQMDFARALFDGDDGVATAHVSADGIEPAARVDIYRNNLREGFIKALVIGFPVIERLVGEDYFRQLALEFLKAHPSRAGDIHHIGAPFAPFLRQQFAGTEYAYFADVAALEWAHQEVLIAKDMPPVSAEALRNVDPSRYEDIRFTLHPARALVQSAYPIVRIWRANQPDASGEDIIDLRAGGENVLVMRTPECVEFHQLPIGDFVALLELARGAPLGTALEAAQIAEGAFDLGAALTRFFRLQLFTACSVNPPSARYVIPVWSSAPDASGQPSSPPSP